MLKRAEVGIIAAVLVDCQDLAFVFGQGDEFVSFSGCYGEGLLDDDCEPSDRAVHEAERG